MKRPAKLELYLNCASDYSIVGNDGQTYTPEEARKLHADGKVSDFNMGFQRLIEHDFDVQAVRDSFR